MINQQLLDYIKQQTQEGTDREQIKTILLNSGWQAEDVEEAFATLENKVTPANQAEASKPPLTKLPGIFATLGQAFSIYKQRFWTLMGIFFAYLILAVVLGSVFLFVLFLEIPLVLEILIWLLFAVLSFLLVIWQFVAMLFAIKDANEGIGIIESFRRGWRRLLSSSWIMILQLFFMMAGYLLLFIPGLIFAIWFVFANFVLVTEDVRGMNALLKSREYVRGRWFRVFWRIFPIGLLLSLAFFLITAILNGVFGGTVSLIIATLIQMILTPLFLVYVFLIYQNLKELRGDFVFTPTAGKKAPYLIFLVVGLLILSLISYSVVSSYIKSLDSNSAQLGVVDEQDGVNFTSDRVVNSDLELNMSDREIRERDLELIKNAMLVYYSDQGRSPETLAELQPNYLEFIPLDINDLPYQYTVNEDFSAFRVCGVPIPDTVTCRGNGW